MKKRILLKKLKQDRKSVYGRVGRSNGSHKLVQQRRAWLRLLRAETRRQKALHARRVACLVWLEEQPDSDPRKAPWLARLRSVMQPYKQRLEQEAAMVELRKATKRLKSRPPTDWNSDEPWCGMKEVADALLLFTQTTKIVVA